MSPLARCTLPLLLAIGSAAASCGPSRDLTYRFQLASCPSHAFTLPPDVEEPPYRVTSHLPKAYKAAAGEHYTVYRLTATTGDAREMYFRVQLQRGSPRCTLDVAWRQALIDEAYDRRVEEELTQGAEIVARLTMRGSSSAHLPAVRVDTLET